MRIVVLDGFALNPGDLSWRPLEELGQCAIYHRTPPESVIERAAEAEILLTNKAPVSRESIQRLPRLTYVGVLATGYDIVDIAAARRRRIVVTNIPNYGTPSVAQMVFAHLLNLTTRAADHARGVREGRWQQNGEWCYWDHPLVEISGLSIGIIGFGRIGQAVATIARAFGMKVLAFDTQQQAGPRGDVEWVDLDEIFRRSDVVSLHCPLTEANRRMVGRDRLSQMKRTAYLINTSRGPLVDEAALAEALHDGRIAGAGLDVLSAEPPAADNPLLLAPNCFLTPHIAWATQAARQRLLTIAVENVLAFLGGRPQNVV
jgi:glycerate dehydrogenase